MKPKATSVLSPADVEVSEVGSASSARTGNRRRLSRALDRRACKVIVRHRPTGIARDGEVLPGHYSREQMRRLKEELTARLLRELEQAVAKHLRVPGR
jgi:hypothetical protein